VRLGFVGLPPSPSRLTSSRPQSVVHHGDQERDPEQPKKAPVNERAREHSTEDARRVEDRCKLSEDVPSHAAKDKREPRSRPEFRWRLPSRHALSSREGRARYFGGRSSRIAGATGANVAVVVTADAGISASLTDVADLAAARAAPATAAATSPAILNFAA
jgi:hypothetical protein